jgi:hypothetical protein
MKIVRDEEKGIMAIDTGYEVMRYARCKYDGKLRCWKPDSIIPMSDYVALPKVAAQKYARSIHFPLTHIERLGNHYGVLYGIRYDVRSDYFMAVWE